MIRHPRRETQEQSRGQPRPPSAAAVRRQQHEPLPRRLARERETAAATRVALLRERQPDAERLGDAPTLRVAQQRIGPPARRKPPSASPVNTTVWKLSPRASSGVSTATPSRPTRPAGTRAAASDSRSAATASETSTSSSSTSRACSRAAASPAWAPTSGWKSATATLAKNRDHTAQPARSGAPPQAPVRSWSTARRPVVAASLRRRLDLPATSSSSSTPARPAPRAARGAGAGPPCREPGRPPGEPAPLRPAGLVHHNRSTRPGRFAARSRRRRAG